MVLELLQFGAYVAAWLFVGTLALSFFDSDDELLFRTYVGFEHAWQAFLFVSLWPITLALHWAGVFDEHW